MKYSTDIYKPKLEMILNAEGTDPQKLEMVLNAEGTDPQKLYAVVSKAVLKLCKEAFLEARKKNTHIDIKISIRNPNSFKKGQTLLELVWHDNSRLDTLNTS